jgi:hypothetical protein
MRAVSDAELGYLGHAKGCGVLVGGKHCLHDDVDPDQRGTEFAGNSEAGATTSAAHVEQSGHGRSSENVRHRAQFTQRHEPERVSFDRVVVAEGFPEYRLERRASRQQRQRRAVAVSFMKRCSSAELTRGELLAAL